MKILSILKLVKTPLVIIEVNREMGFMLAVKIPSPLYKNCPAIVIMGRTAVRALLSRLIWSKSMVSPYWWAVFWTRCSATSYKASASVTKGSIGHLLSLATASLWFLSWAKALYSKSGPFSGTFSSSTPSCTPSTMRPIVESSHVKVVESQLLWGGTEAATARVPMIKMNIYRMWNKE